MNEVVSMERGEIVACDQRDRKKSKSKSKQILKWHVHFFFFNNNFLFPAEDLIPSKFEVTFLLFDLAEILVADTVDAIRSTESITARVCVIVLLIL